MVNSTRPWWCKRHGWIWPHEKISLKFINCFDEKSDCAWNVIFSLKMHLLSVEALVSWGQNTEFWKPRLTHLPILPQRLMGITFLLFCLSSWAVLWREKCKSPVNHEMTLAWFNLIEITVQLHKVSPESSLHSYSTHAVQTTTQCFWNH